MSEAATTTLPTRRDEAWRYSAVEALEGLATLAEWRTIEVAPGETFRECFTIEDSEAPDLRRMRVSVGEGARCEMFAVIAGAPLGRIEIEVTLARGSHFELGGVTLGGRDTVREFVTRVVHAQPEATSNQTIRSVHWGKGTGNFLGSIDVVRNAQKTDAAQDFKGLLLEKGASVNAVPQLEIFADDVKCAHGATVGQLDQAARYYMASRGIPPELSRKLLVRAFLGDAFVALEDDAESKRLMDIALAKLDAHL